ncbi:MAG: hypothetical protein NTW86_05165 [Candidatus Sumerlaeota bacterium]|nr:hypothetical protein [Candidatus Sumerlaeota bacterium]
MDNETRDSANLLNDPQGPLHNKSVSISDLNSDSFDMIEPLQVDIEHYPGEVVSKVSELDLWASEATESEALLAIKSAICDLWEDLQEEDEARLGQLPRMWKRILNRKIRARAKA